MKPGKQRYQGCQVQAVTPAGRRIWRFNVGKQDVVLAQELNQPASQTPPKPSAANDWKALVSPQLNIAWLPADSVFVRAIQLPAADPSELPAMVEFQIEKISPLPVNQIVWTALGIPHPDGQQQTALVTIANRAVVEEFLNAQVEAGFTADQLDLPLVRWWSGLQPATDGIWLLLEENGDRWQGLAGWHVGGVWRDVTLLQLPAGPGAVPLLLNQLGQMAWAGEMDGWLKVVPEIHLAATLAQAQELTGPLTDWSEHPVLAISRPEPTALATASARALRDGASSTLMPAEWAAQQRQKFIDRLWLNGLGALGVAYLIFLFGFLIWLNVRKYQLDDLRSEVAAMGINYTNTLQLKAQVGILEEQVALRYAALDAWQAVVSVLPAELTLTQMDFQKGRTLQLSGTVSPDSVSEVTKFNSELIKAKLNNQPLFAKVKPAVISSRPGAPSASWSFDAELQRSDAP